MALIKCSECGNMVSDKAISCPKCGAPVVIPIKCEECGGVVPPSSVSCPHCGAPCNSSMIKCEECGQMIPCDSKSCSFCGAPIESINDYKPNLSASKLKIQWKGKYAMVKCSIKIFVNNQYIGEYSYNEGFCIEVPITSSEMLVEVLCNGVKKTFQLQLTSNMNYTCNLIMPNGVNGIAGFSYELSNSYGNVKKDTDKLGIGMMLLCFLIPIVGVIYYFVKRSEYPIKAKVALYCGLTAWAAYTFTYMIRLF